MLGIQSLEESQLRPYRLLKRGSPLLTYDEWSNISKGHVEASPPICFLHHPTSS